MKDIPSWQQIFWRGVRDILIIVLLLLLGFLLLSCSHTREFARQKLETTNQCGQPIEVLSDWVTVEETAIGLLSPSVKIVYELNKKTGERRPPSGTVAVGNGASGNAIRALGDWVSFREIGQGLEGSGDKTSTSINSRTVFDPTFIGPQLPPPPVDTHPHQHGKGHYRTPNDWRD